MIVTIEWMEEWFRRFDQEYFGGKLPVPELGLTHAKTRLGQLAYKRASRWGRTKLYDFKLSMSTYYDMTDKQAKSVLIHEMIHYIIGYTGLKDTSAHGVVFKGLMDKLNSPVLVTDGKYVIRAFLGNSRLPVRQVPEDLAQHFQSLPDGVVRETVLKTILYSVYSQTNSEQK